MAALPGHPEAATPAFELRRHRTPHSRWLGTAVLVAALILTVVMPAVLNPGFTGIASPIELPAPPRVGSCLLFQHQQMYDVDCGEPHTAEVMIAWPAGAGPARKVTFDDRGRPIDDEKRAAVELEQCVPAVDAYLGAADGLTAGHWNAMPPKTAAQFVVGTENPERKEMRWSACVLTAPKYQTFVGSMRNAVLGNVPRWPAPFSTCIAQSYYFPDVSNCDRRHRIEFLGYFVPSQEMIDSGRIYDSYTKDDAQAECLDLARQVTGAADPTYGGRIRISAEPVFGLPASDGRAADPGAQPGGSLHIPDCLAEVTGEGSLVSTLVGLADGELELVA